MFGKVYHRHVIRLSAARFERSSPASLLPPKIYMTSAITAAAWYARGKGRYPVVSICIHFPDSASNLHTSLNQVKPSVPPNLWPISVVWRYTLELTHKDRSSR